MTYETLDAELLNELIGNGRTSLRSLGDNLGVSVTTVSNHLEAFESEEIIDGYTPIIDYKQLGYDVTAIIQLKIEGSAMAALTDRLREQKRMVSVYETTGDYDIIAVGKFADTDGMNDQIKALLTDVDINESNTSVVLNAVVENEQFELEVAAD